MNHSAEEDPVSVHFESDVSSGKGLRTDSVGLLAVVALGLSSVAPAYSIAVTLGFVVMVVGHLAPAALLVGFVPILLTAFAFRELNREMPDCGTTFVWNSRAFGPYTGWLCGGWGPQIAAEVQYVLLGLQLVALVGFGAAAFARPGAEAPSLSWLNPLAFDGFGPFAEAVLLCLFIYWGWDALITVNEETKDKDKTPGRAAVISTVLLLGTYLFTAFAAISFAGTGTDGVGLGNADNAADVLATLGPPVLGTVLAKVVQFAICVSAISALLTCVISSPRGSLSMGTHGALPKAFTRIHPKFQTPAFGTVFFGAAAAVVLTVLATVSENFLGDAILSIGLLIAFYYGVTGLACVWYFRHRLTTSVRDLFLKGVLPAVGGLIMLAAFARSAHDMLAPTYGATSFDGVGGVFLLGVGAIAVGAATMLVVRTRLPDFFRGGRKAVTHITVTDLNDSGA